MSTSRTYQNYHRHTHYTNPKISDSIARNEDYAKRAVELDHGIISSCEHGYQGRYIECHKLAQEYNLKFLFGTEAYWVNNRHEQDRANCHIFLGARNENGRQAINDVLSEANISGFHYQARLDRELILSLPPKDVIVTSACIAFWKYDDVESFVEQLRDHFGTNFFLEVQYHNTESQRLLNHRILRLHNELKIPIIMGCDSHYINAGDGVERDDFIVSKGMTYDDEEGWYLDYPDGDEAYRRFAEQCVLSHQEIIDAMDNTNVFLDVDAYDNPCFNTDIKMPTLYPDWTQEQRDAEYRRLVMQGFESYRSQIPDDQLQHYLDEANREMDIVTETKMSDYFIDNYHIIKRGKELGGKLTKSGRGCFTKDALVTTLDGLKPINEVEIGDIVIDLNGKFQMVENTMSYDIDESMVQIQTSYSFSKHFTSICTLDHKILAKRDGNLKWIEAVNLKKGDCAVRPITFSQKTDNKYLYIPILSVKKIGRVKTTVYDLSVSNSHSYVLNGMVVHNSAVSFATNMFLGFTEVDRIAANVKMYPERFMSATRILQSKSLPD